MKLTTMALAAAVTSVSLSPAFADDQMIEDVNFHNYYVELKTGAGTEPHPEVNVTDTEIDVLINRSIVISKRNTGGISTKTEFDTTAAGIVTTKDASFLSHGLRVHFS